MAMTTIANEIDHHVARERVPILCGQLPDANHGFEVFTVDVKNGTAWRLAISAANRDECSCLRSRREPDQIVDDDVHGPADRESLEICVVQCLRPNPLARERGIAVNQQRQNACLATSPARTCLARARPSATGSTASKWLALDTS